MIIFNATLRGAGVATTVYYFTIPGPTVKAMRLDLSLKYRIYILPPQYGGYMGDPEPLALAWFVKRLARTGRGVRAIVPTVLIHSRKLDPDEPYCVVITLPVGTWPNYKPSKKTTRRVPRPKDDDARDATPPVRHRRKKRTKKAPPINAELIRKMAETTESAPRNKAKKRKKTSSKKRKMR